MAHDVFVSYSAADKPIADAVCAGLEARGIRCWMAPRDILPGLDWGAAIIDAINEAKAMVLVFSSNANASKQIKREVERAVSKGVTIVPLRVEDVPLGKTLEYFISTPHWLDAISPPLERHIGRLAETVQALLARPSRSTDAGIRPTAAPRSAPQAATAPAYAPTPVSAAAPFPAAAPAPRPAPRRGIWIAAAVAAIILVAVLAATLGRSHPPQILSVQFPAAIYAGQQGTGRIYFRDKKGDVANARFDVVQSTTFQPFSFATTGLAGKTAGEIAFWLTCPVPQHIVLQAVLTDAAGKQSNPVPFAFDVQAPPAAAHPLPGTRPRRPGRDFTIEAPNGIRFKIPR